MVKGAPDELIVGQLRDWNEELQTARELPADNSHLKIYRDKLIFKVSCGVTAGREETVSPTPPRAYYAYTVRFLITSPCRLASVIRSYMNYKRP